MSFDVTTLALAKSYTNQHGGSGGSDPIVENAKQTGGFGYTEQGDQTVITWDGDTDGRVVKGGRFCKVSELTPTINEVIGGVIITKTSDGIFPAEITADSITAVSEHLYIVQGYGNSMVVVALEDSEVEGITFEPGLYYSKSGSGVESKYIKSFTYGTPDTVHKIDEKYLPVIPAVTNTATVGQTIKVSAVDENGKPTKWEAVDMPSGGGSGVQSDWNQNDDTKPDYVKNRPFYTSDPVETVFVEESTVTFTKDSSSGLYKARVQSTFVATVGETYKVSWDGTVYECTCVLIEGFPAIGNPSIMGPGSDTGEPFLMGVDNGKKINILTADTSASHTFSISGFVSEVVKIDEKYLPEGFIVNVVGEESNLGNTYLLFDKTDEEIYSAVNNGITVTLKIRGYNLQCIKEGDIMFWGVIPSTLGSSGITKLEVLYVSRKSMGWVFKRTYIEANALA